MVRMLADSLRSNLGISLARPLPSPVLDDKHGDGRAPASASAGDRSGLVHETTVAKVLWLMHVLAYYFVERKRKH